MKTYKRYKHIMEDFQYYKRLKRLDDNYVPRPIRRFIHDLDDSDTYSDSLISRIRKKIKTEYKNHMERKYLDASKENTPLGRFIRKYELPMNELLCMLELIDRSDSFLEKYEDREKIFYEHNIFYERSKMKKFQLVYKITNPYAPIKTCFKVSYKAQLELKGKPYTDVYQQLDLELEEESKSNSPEELNGLYYIIKPREGMEGLVASKKLKDGLKAAIAREKQHDKIFKQWGFAQVLDYGKGTTLNFRGLPGTGKTLAAGCLAKEIGKELLMVRYDQLQSCWVGQTEKHIQSVFKLAKMKKAVLFFDEADAIALSRKCLTRSWEMSQVNTLLKELERFEGVCIFATNFAEKYDEAFERRLTMHVDFEMPGTEQRVRILDKLLPKKSRNKNVNLTALKLENFSGGDLKNVSLNAAGVAANKNSEKIMQKHLEEAIIIVRKAKQKSSLEEPKYYG